MTLELIDEILNESEVAVNSAYINWEDKTAINAIKYVRDNGLTNLCIACEEIAELQQAITKMIRGKGDKRFVSEEIADVYLGMLFINNVYGTKLNINTHSSTCLFEKEIRSFYKDKYSIYQILQILNRFQNAIFEAIINNNSSSLQKRGEEVLMAIESLKIMYEISDKDIYKIRNYKVKRLSERIINKTQI